MLKNEMKHYQGTAIEVSLCAFSLNCSIYPVIYAVMSFLQNFLGEGAHQMFGVSDFRRSERNFTIGQDPKI